MDAKDEPDEYIESESVRMWTFAAATFNLTDEMSIGMRAEIELFLEILRTSRYVFQNIRSARAVQSPYRPFS